MVLFGRCPVVQPITLVSSVRVTVLNPRRLSRSSRPTFCLAHLKQTGHSFCLHAIVTATRTNPTAASARDKQTRTARAEELVRSLSDAVNRAGRRNRADPEPN